MTAARAAQRREIDEAIGNGAPSHTTDSALATPQAADAPAGNPFGA
jgi:hypothetical protein